jgi:hypothetical protein
MRVIRPIAETMDSVTLRCADFGKLDDLIGGWSADACSLDTPVIRILANLRFHQLSISTVRGAS